MLRPEKPILPAISTLLARAFPNIKAHGAITRLFDTENSLQRFAPPALDEKVWSILEAFKLPKRRSQWLTGRLCAKQAITGYCRKYHPQTPEPAENTLFIRNTPNGRPELEAQHLPLELQNLDISISHSGDYAAALVADVFCGIDIQKRSETLNRVRDRFCRSEEGNILQDQLPAFDQLWQLTLLWAAKEAVKKTLSSIRMPGFLDFILTQLETIDAGIFLIHFRRNAGTVHQPTSVSVAVTAFDDYALALCLFEGTKNA
jgi:4'-phosphopantetheinyl transferase EntD